MPSSTIAAHTSFTNRPRRSPLHRRYPAHLGELSTAAGLHRRPWEARLRRALADDLFVLHYQPIVSLEDSQISHYEALVRLCDQPDGTLTAPGEFLPAAERYGLVGSLDRLVISKAIACMAAQAQAGAPVRLAVNLSGLSITDPGLLEHIHRELERRHVDPAALVLEITETAAICDMSLAEDFCRAVRALGCAVALDDFGAGFGSFSYLKHLPFDYLKIDGDFIRELPSSPKDQLVVKALVTLARGMGKRTIAEFVTSPQTLELLRSFGVDHAQGYEIGRPARTLPPFALAA
jgi:EAL domain-containing protein (putative c-di-GMP-specific phosphodiesterase class I)